MIIVWLLAVAFSLIPLIAHKYVESISLINNNIFVLFLFLWLAISIVIYYKIIASQNSIPKKNFCILVLVPFLILNLSALYSINRLVSDTIAVDKAVQAYKSDLFYLNEFEPDTVTFSGSIGPKTLDSLISILDIASIRRVVIDVSSGGVISSALELAKIFRELELEIVVTEYCVSSCVIIATSGKVLLTTNNSLFGFHSSAALGDVSENSAYLSVIEGNKLMSAALRKNGFSEEILRRITSTSSDSMYYITGYQLIDENLAKLYLE